MARVARTGIIRYRVAPDGVHRVEPLALNAAETFEEWVEMPHKEAREFADEGTGSITWKLFEQVTYEGAPDPTKVWSADIGAVRSCKDSSKHFQIDVGLQRYVNNGTEAGKRYFVQMHEVPNGYRIHAVTDHPDQSCTGGDLMGGE